MTTRREFLIGTAGFATVGAAASEQPIWKAGIITDTHVNKTLESCARTELAFKLFAKHDIDLFVHCGDFARVFDPSGYEFLRKVFDKVFASKRPREVWIYAGHDYMGKESIPFDKAMEEVRSFLKAPNGLWECFDIQGWPIVAYPHHFSEKRLVEVLDETVVKYPDKPIFVFGHEPPLGCADNSVTWGSSKLKRIFSKYPQVVAINGHAHSSLRSELNIWQGEFTNVNAGCLQCWDGELIGASSCGKENYGALILEVFSNRLVFRRYDVRTGVEYAADDPWTIPLPFNPATAPYRRDRRMSVEPKPHFAEGARLTFAADDPFTALTIKIPRAESPNGCYRYQVEVLSDVRGKSSRGDVFGQFYLAEHERKQTVTARLNAGYFVGGLKYILRVTPCNCFGGAGKALEATFVSPEPFHGTRLVDVVDPMADLPFYSDNKLTKKVSVKDGWITAEGKSLWVPLRKDELGTFRMTFEAETDQLGPETMSFHMRTAIVNRPLSSRMQTVAGHNGPVRYAIEFKRKQAGGVLCLALERVFGRVRISNILLERLSPS